MGYFGRHWRGELSLPVAFWVNNGLLMLPLGLALGGLAVWVQVWGESLQAAAAAMLAVAVGASVVGVWAPVGAWRSAGRYLDEGGAALWAGLTRLLMALSLLSTVLMMAVDVLPGLPDQWRLARGQDPLGTLQVQLLPDGRSVRLSGPIVMGSARQFEQALRQAPGLRRVLLDSPGGRLFEADALATLVRERGLHTRATGTCASACTLVFLAGQQRALAPDARLGFHRASVEGANPLHDTLANRALAGLYEAAGLPNDFVRRVLRTPAWGMWFPSALELAAAGVLPPLSFKPALDPQLPADAPLAPYAEALADNLLWRALDQRQPGALEQAAQRLRQSRLAGASPAVAADGAQALALGALPLVLRGAQAPAQAQFLALVADELQARARRQAQAGQPPAARAALDAECRALLVAVRQGLPVEAVAAGQAASSAATAPAAAAVTAVTAAPEAWVAWLQVSLLEPPEPEPPRALSALEAEVLGRELGPGAPARLWALGAAPGAPATAGGRPTRQSAVSAPQACQAAAVLLAQVAALRGPQRRLAVRHWLQAGG